MYTILLATDQPDILRNFQGFSGWETLGFNAPLFASDAEEALAVLSKSAVQAVAIALPPKHSAILYDRLHGQHMLYLEPVADPDALRDVLKRMAGMIEHQAQGQKTPAPMRTTLCETFWQTLLDGLMHSEAVLRNRLLVLELPVSADVSCLMVTLRMINGEQYLDEVWRYGRARLAMALRKFLQAETPDMIYALSGFRAGTLRMLACPVQPMDTQTLRTKALAHIDRALEDITEYLDLELAVEDMIGLDGLKSLLKQGG